MSDVETIKVTGVFGDRKVTKEEFVSEWTNHTRELQRLTCSTPWMEKVSEITAIVKQQAEDEFCATLIQQQNNI
ncbi:hypothetical protein GOV10_02120 [Candidatus Woesearchaeota archaeon]|nr:hypothetical protein [Candidatus Woesearchaeota archaeon]